MTLVRTKRTFTLGLGTVAVIAAAFGVLGAGASPASAQSLSGSWAGGGTITLPSGERERARCRVTFRNAGGGGVNMHAVCATASTRVTQNASLSHLTGGTYAGEFYNTEYGIQGSVRIRMQGANRLTASLSGGGGTAQFSLNR